MCSLKEKTAAGNVHESSQCIVDLPPNWWHVPIKLWELITSSLWPIITVVLWLTINLQSVINLWSTIVTFLVATILCVLILFD